MSNKHSAIAVSVALRCLALNPLRADISRLLESFSSSTRLRIFTYDALRSEVLGRSMVQLNPEGRVQLDHSYMLPETETKAMLQLSQ